MRKDLVAAVAAALEERGLATNPRELKPGELCRLLNSTPLGPVLTDRRLRDQRTRAGLRIGDGRRIDLFRYAAWLFHEPRTAAVVAPQPPSGADDAYARKKAAEAKRNADASAQHRDVAPLPPIVDPKRRESCRLNLRRFLEQYFPGAFRLKWSPDHVKVIDSIQRTTIEGGQFALAMPRGSGKTTILERACLWAVCYGHRRYVAPIGANRGKALQIASSIRTELESNDLLLADFPEVCHPIRRLEGIANRCRGQVHNGERTHMEWGAAKIVLPTIAGSAASGAVIEAGGLIAASRGMKYTRPDGDVARPDLLLIDDPQTDQSAKSVQQCETRERLIQGALLGLAGPGAKLAAFATVTVIRTGDLSDRMLDRERNPDWQGERCKLVYAWPSDEKLWREYGEVRADCLRRKGDISDATKFYRKHRKKMDAGAKVAWPERFEPDEMSAIQHAWNLRLKDEIAFWAERQNEPLPESDERVDLLSADTIAAKLNNLPRGAIYGARQRVVAYVDVQKDALYWTAAAFADDFTGDVVDYGVYPDQGIPYFTLRELRMPLSQAHPGTGMEGWLYAGLDSLVNQLAAREWPRDGGARLRIEQILVDANWGESTDVVHLFCRQSRHANIILPSHGKGIGASNPTMASWRRKAGERHGHHWVMPNVHGTRSVRHVLIDTNFWKSFVHARLAVAMGDVGCLALFGDSPMAHRMFADHLTAERPIATEARGRVVDEWKNPQRRDNHWFDCLVGCCVAASLRGCALPEAGGAAAKLKPKISLRDIQRRRRGGG